MDPVTGIIAAQAIQGLTSAAQDLLSSASESFEDVMRSNLSADSTGQINEEELFAALLSERIGQLKGDEAASEFNQALAEEKGKRTRADGYVAVEDAANAALARLENSGTISSEEKAAVYAQSFEAAQLDGNKNALYDGRGGSDDPTIAVAALESALSTARSMLNGEMSGDSGDSAAEGDTGSADLSSSQSADSSSSGNVISPNGNEVDGNEGFVWKPISDSDGNVVVILPPDMTDGVAEVVLRDENNQEIERGRGTGIANNGREHFRFNRPGEDYSQNLRVEVRMLDGSMQIYEIPNPSERYD